MDLDDAFRSAMNRGSSTRREPLSLEEAAREFGTTRAEQNRGLAGYFGVSTRTVQRWRTTGAERRSPGADRMKRMRIAASRRAGARRRGQARQSGASVTVGGRIRVSRDTRDRSIAGLSLSGEAMSDVLDRLAEGDREGAMELLQESLGAENGFGDALILEDIDSLDLDVGDTGEEE